MWRRWLVLPIVTVLLGALMITSLAWKERANAKRREALTSVESVDMGVVLKVVKRACDCEPAEGDERSGPRQKDGSLCAHGEELIPGKPRLTVLREHHRGRMVNINGRRVTWGGPSKNPVVWLCSEQQEPLILHGKESALWSLVQGSEGSGKTTVLVMWVGLRVLEHINTRGNIWITAPTNDRLAVVKEEIERYWPESWARFSERYQQYRFHAGPKVRLKSAVQRSKEAGSPFQGGNLVAQGGDEWQDHYAREADIIARGRAAPNNEFKRLLTSTFKDDSGWRTFRAGCDANPRDWLVRKLLGLESPFAWTSNWTRFRRGVTEREYQRRVLAMDVGPERQLYYSWRRSLVSNDNTTKHETRQPGNLRPLPLGAVDVTTRELAPYGRNLTVLLGHDPGKRQHVTEFLKAYEFPGERRRDANGKPTPPLVRWFVVDEVTSTEATVETHVRAVKARCVSAFGCFGTDWRGQQTESTARPMVRIDPHTASGDEHPDRTVYAQWRSAGFVVLAAAYNPQTKKPTPIKVEARVDLVNTLLCNTDGDRRLFVLCDDRGSPMAPRLVAAFESMERNEQWDAEWSRKDENDLSHWPCSVAFALWSIEKPRVDAWRTRAAA